MQYVAEADQYLGRVLAGLNTRSDTFTLLPPLFPTALEPVIMNDLSDAELEKLQAETLPRCIKEVFCPNILLTSSEFIQLSGYARIGLALILYHFTPILGGQLANLLPGSNTSAIRRAKFSVQLEALRGVLGKYLIKPLYGTSELKSM